MKKKILIYNGKGASPLCVQLLKIALQQTNLDCTIESVDRHAFKNDDWHNTTALLIFPGGLDLPYHHSLKGMPNQSIRDYVNKGGNYLGICAGAYYGSASIEFEKGTPLEVVQKRELGFFPGLATGSAYGLNEFCYDTHRGAKVAKLEWIADTGAVKQTAAYYNGGCVFVNIGDGLNTKVLARYADLPGHPSAIIQCRVGKGMAILSGVHPEYNGFHVEDEQDPYLVQLIPILKSIEQERRELFNLILECFFRVGTIGA